MEKLYFNTINLIINAPRNFFLFRFKKEFPAIKVVFSNHRLWRNSQLQNIILVDKLLNEQNINNDLAEILFCTYLNSLRISRVEAVERAWVTYNITIFKKYYKIISRK